MDRSDASMFWAIKDIEDKLTKLGWELSATSTAFMVNRRNVTSMSRITFHTIDSLHMWLCGYMCGRDEAAYPKRRTRK